MKIKACNIFQDPSATYLCAMGGISLLAICLKILFMSRGCPQWQDTHHPGHERLGYDSSQKATIATVSLCNEEQETLEHTGTTTLQYWHVAWQGQFLWTKLILSPIFWCWLSWQQVSYGSPDLHPCRVHRKRYQLQTMAHWFRWRQTFIGYWTTSSCLAHCAIYLCWVGVLHRVISCASPVDGIRASGLSIKHQKHHPSGWPQLLYSKRQQQRTTAWLQATNQGSYWPAPWSKHLFCHYQMPSTITFFWGR